MSLARHQVQELRVKQFLRPRIVLPAVHAPVGRESVHSVDDGVYLRRAPVALELEPGKELQLILDLLVVGVNAVRQPVERA